MKICVYFCTRNQVIYLLTSHSLIIMMIKKLLKCSLMAAFALVSFNAAAGNVNADAAQAAANNFLKQKFAQQGKLMAPATADIKLTHTEASTVSGNAYYVFNITGGGWVIIAGDDRATQVLAYSDHGYLNMNNLPSNTKGYLDRFKTQIEKVQNYKGEFVTKKTSNRTNAVVPMLKSNWGQDYFFCAQCPKYYGSDCPVGCAGLAMAQIINYWEYPKSSEGLPAYTNEYTYSMVPALGATTFDFDLILDQYTYLTEDGRLGLVAGVTQENKDEVAKLCRYSSQSCLMNFRSDASGSNVLKQKNGFLKMGFDSNAKLVGIEAWPSRETWNTWDYTDEEWIALINAQLEAGHPIPYSSEGGEDGHAFVVDGVDADGLYHCNWGFYGYADGYFAYGAFTPTILSTTLNLNSGLFMVIDLYPYEGYVSPNAPQDESLRGDVNNDTFVTIDDVTALINYLLTDDATGINLEAADCNGIAGITIDDVTALINYLLTDQW